MKMADYHALRRLSASGIGEYLTDPATYYASREQDPPTIPPRPDVEEQDTGSLLHALVLEGQEAFDRLAAVWTGGHTKKGDPTMSKNSSEYREFVKESTKDGRIVTTRDTVDLIQAMANALYAREDVRPFLFDGGLREHTLLWEESGVEAKARLDNLLERPRVIVDLKSTFAANFPEVERQAMHLGYHRKDAWYRRGYLGVTGEHARDFVFVSVRNVYPHNVWLWRNSEMALAVANVEIDTVIADILGRRQTGDWTPDECREVQIAEINPWRISPRIKAELERRNFAAMGAA